MDKELQQSIFKYLTHFQETCSIINGNRFQPLTITVIRLKVTMIWNHSQHHLIFKCFYKHKSLISNNQQSQKRLQNQQI